MKYDYEDIIINPEDERAEIGEEYFAAITPAACLRSANSGAQAAELKYIDPSSDRPFFFADSWWPCIIRKKESEKKLVPFDFNDPNDRDFLRGKWVMRIDGIEHTEAQIVGFDWISPDLGINIEIGTSARMSAEEFLTYWEFLDGSPCGKEVME